MHFYLQIDLKIGSILCVSSQMTFTECTVKSIHVENNIMWIGKFAKREEKNKPLGCVSLHKIL